MIAGGGNVLVADFAREPDGAIRILSPAVGWWIDPPQSGALLGPGSALGRLECLGRRFLLVVPPGAAGWAATEVGARRIVPVEFGETLVRLTPLGEGALDLGDEAAVGRPGGAKLPAGTRAVVAPSDGVFYGAPSPGAEPYVRVGSRVSLGQTVGMVEVMKTFHQLTYGGPGFPESAEVVEIRAREGGEVRAGEVIFLLR